MRFPKEMQVCWLTANPLAPQAEFSISDLKLFSLTLLMQAGAFTHPDKGMRENAIALTIEGGTWAKELGAKELVCRCFRFLALEYCTGNASMMVEDFMYDGSSTLPSFINHVSSRDLASHPPTFICDKRSQRPRQTASSPSACNGR